MVKIYNSLTQKKEELIPLKSNHISIYVCGPTVYDFCHIGNGRTYTAFDTIVRYLQWRGYEVTHVRNITDIDDKIIKRANDSNKEFTEVVNEFTQAMHDDFNALGLLKPNFEPKATEFIPHMITMIEKLIEENYAYVAENGDVYYSVRNFADYGCLSHRDIESLVSGARVEINDVKKDPLDFVLWKLAKPKEPNWPSPWGAGRPGWHIECSAMSTRMLGETIDIHGGGRDLIFPHHENEIAQSEAATSKKFVNYWMHAGYLQIEKEKMSKSLGNFLTIRELLARHKPEVLRFFLMSSHYRSSLNFSEDGLTQARSSLERFYNALRNLTLVDEKTITEFENKFIEAMDDDFNTPIAVAVLFDITHEIQRLKDSDATAAGKLGSVLTKLGNSLGILTSDPNQFLQHSDANLDITKIEEYIRLRNQARSEKNWQEADRMRDELLKMNIVLEDGQEGTSWKSV